MTARRGLRAGADGGRRRRTGACPGRISLPAAGAADCEGGYEEL